MSDQKKLIEAALFISPRPLNLQELMRISSIGSLGLLKKEIEDLTTEYTDRGIEIIQTQEGWQMQVKQEFLSKVANLTPYSDLSEGAKRTLAVVIYKEPLKQSELIKLQGNKAYVYIKELEKRALVKSERVGHTKNLRVTNEFERYFGESKEAIRERIRATLEGGEAVKPQGPVPIKQPSPELRKTRKRKPTEKEAEPILQVATGEVTSLKELSVEDLK